MVVAFRKKKASSEEIIPPEQFKRGMIVWTVDNRYGMRVECFCTGVYGEVIPMDKYREYKKHLQGRPERSCRRVEAGREIEPFPEPSL